MEERNSFNRERAAGLYCTSSYFVSKNFIEGPLSIIFPLTTACIGYFMVGFQRDIENFGIFALFVRSINITFVILVAFLIHCLMKLVTASFTAGSLLLFIGALSPNLIVASILSPLALVLLFLFGGRCSSFEEATFKIASNHLYHTHTLTHVQDSMSMLPTYLFGIYG